jgi:DNA segregation ATPase FtsK/SpoIIIE, S-DNA-T family
VLLCAHPDPVNAVSGCIGFLGMSRKRKLPEPAPRAPLFDDLSSGTRQAIAAVVVGVVGIFFLLSLLAYAGVAGQYTDLALTHLFGTGAWLAPLASGALVVALLRPRDDKRISTAKLTGIGILFFAALGILELYQKGLGGMAAFVLNWPLLSLFGQVVTGVLLGALLLIGVFLTFNVGLHFPRRTVPIDEEDELTAAELSALPEEALIGAEDNTTASDTGTEETTGATKKGALKKMTEKVSESFGGKAGDIVVKNWGGAYVPPALSLLGKDKGKPQAGDVKSNSLIIKRTLKDFGISVEMDTVECGPTITRYSLKPAQGVRLSRIVALQQELQSALRAVDIRIEAPIPGKSLVGIEVPNLVRSTIGLASLLANPEYTDSPKPLLVALGKDVAGGVHFANIARMPHALIAGTTGSGKSALIHDLILSLLFRNSPEQLRFLMVDPKRVELTLYEGIPHLLTPVITDAKKTLLMLKWAVKEMERRYDILQSERIQNIDSYHTNVYRPAKAEWEAKGRPDDAQASLPEPLPYIVVIMDELADLMLAYPRELEALIVRLAQMSRAVGIHLILATQRPSVNVITGTIKANIPTRIALNVASQIDSRTILDQVGAEKLLGKGDMLYLSSDSPKPMRLQSAFVPEDELKEVVTYLKGQDAQSLDTISLDEKEGGTGDAFIKSIMGGGDDDADDDLYNDAKAVVLEAGKASTSLLQRRLRIGYGRAARLIDLLEDNGVVGPENGSKGREILEGRGGDGLADEPEDGDNFKRFG